MHNEKIEVKNKYKWKRILLIFLISAGCFTAGLFLSITAFPFYWIVFVLIMVYCLLFLLALVLSKYIEHLEQKIGSMASILDKIFPVIILFLLFWYKIAKETIDKQAWSTSARETVYLIMFVIMLWFAENLVYKQYQLNKMAEKLGALLKTLEQYSSFNPIFYAKDTFKDVVHNISSLRAAKPALSFANDSLSEISRVGFAQLDITFSQYTEHLLKLLDLADTSILGTYTNRPKYLFEILLRAEKEIKDGAAMGGAQFTVKYIRAINDKFKNYTPHRKTRIVILTNDEIEKILVDASTTMAPNGPTKRIPEISWFLNDINKNFNIYWTSDQIFKIKFADYLGTDNQFEKILKLPNGQISDHAIFDDEIIITWREYNLPNVDEASGTLLMNWTNEVKGRTLMLSNKLYELNEENYEKNIGLFLSFERLVTLLADSQSKRYFVPRIKELLERMNELFQHNYGWENDAYKIDWSVFK